MYSSQQAAPNLYLQPPAAEIASLGSYQHSSDRNSSKRSREGQCLTSSTHREDTDVQKKRKLDLVKCERCRIDKQKCTPTDRIWPTRCQRCITKDFPCSEGKRAQRGSKHALPEPAPSNSNEKGSKEVPGKNISDIDFLLGYQNILSIASGQLQHLGEEIFEFFRWSSYFRRSARDLCGDLNAALVSILDIVNDLTRNQIALLSQNEMRIALSNQILVGSVLSTLSTRLYTCHLCEKEQGRTGEKIREKSKEYPLSFNSSIEEDTIEHLEQTGAICQEVLVRYAQVSAMIHCFWQKTHVLQITDYLAQSCSRVLSMHTRAISMIGESNNPRLSTQGENLLYLIPGQGEDNISRDLLGRSILHQLLDEHADPEAIDIRLKGFQCLEVESLYQVQDQLSRTLLHLLCHKGSYEAVERSLQMGADPSVTTIYGHLPLHYAARRGNYHMCVLLLTYKGRFNVEQEDEFGYAAYEYAADENHSDIEFLLKDAAEEQRTSRTSSEDSL